jgi:DNA-binding CsgD family transcriptional regulator
MARQNDSILESPAHQMTVLRTSDINTLLSAVEILNAEGEALSERVLNALDYVIPNDLIAIDSFPDSESDGLIHWDNEPEVFTPAIAEACEVVFESHPFDNPLIVEQVHRRSDSVLKLTDFRDEPGFRNGPYFNEILRPLEIDRQMGVMLKVAPDLRLGCAINRKGPDFTERERGIVTMLAPHLAGAVSVAMEREQRQALTRRLSGVLEAVASSTIVLSDKGDVLEMPEASRLLLEKYYEDDNRNGAQLPPPLADWLMQRRGGSGHVAPELFLNREATTLRIAASHETASGEVILLLREKQKLSAHMMEALGLTPRQAEVLYWMSRGKSDDVIAELLGTSRRTIEKHAEHIFTKLGVDSRTAAAVAAIEALVEKGRI